MRIMLDVDVIRLQDHIVVTRQKHAESTRPDLREVSLDSLGHIATGWVAKSTGTIAEASQVESATNVVHRVQTVN